MKERPTGFVARCQCGQVVAALGITYINPDVAAKELGEWLMRGDTVEPRFGGTWSETVSACQCTELREDAAQ